MLNIAKISPKEVPAILETIINMGNHLHDGEVLPALMLVGTPRIGKTRSAMKFLREQGYEIIYCVPGNMSAGDLTLLVSEEQEDGTRRTVYSSPSDWPRKGDPKIAGKKFAFIVDDLHLAPADVQGPFMSILDMRRIGNTEHYLPDDTVVVVTTNYNDGVNNHVNEILTTNQGRLISVEVSYSSPSLLEYAQEQNWHPSVLAYLKLNPLKGYSYFEEAGNCGNMAYASPSGWSKVSSIVYSSHDKINTPQEVAIAGSIGSTVAMDFLVQLRTTFSQSKPEFYFNALKVGSYKVLLEKAPQEQFLAWSLAYNLVGYALEREDVDLAVQANEILLRMSTALEASDVLPDIVSSNLEICLEKFSRLGKGLQFMKAVRSNSIVNSHQTKVVTAFDKK
jgi:hypothetical protein